MNENPYEAPEIPAERNRSRKTVRKAIPVPALRTLTFGVVILIIAGPIGLVGLVAHIQEGRPALAMVFGIATTAAIAAGIWLIRQSQQMK